jgi:hypothetical protein
LLAVSEEVPELEKVDNKKSTFKQSGQMLEEER